MRGNLALAIFNLGMVYRAVLPAADRLTTADRRQPTANSRPLTADSRPLY